MTTVNNVSLWAFDDFPTDLREKIIAEDWKTMLVEMQQQNFAEVMENELIDLKNERSGTLISLIEQVLAINANTYLPSFPSSWDSYVIDQRMRQGHKGAPEQFDLMRAEVARVRC